jgi:hypothetical protein
MKNVRLGGQEERRNMTSKVNLAEKLSQMTDYWKPRIVGQLNGLELKLAKYSNVVVEVKTLPWN